MFFFESLDATRLTRDQQALVNGLKFREELEAAGHYFAGRYDHNSVMQSRQECLTTGGCRTVVEVKPDMEPWWDAVRGDPMPRIVIAPLEERTQPDKIQDFPLPASVEEVWSLLEGAQ
jgi:hypothetical protein